MNINYDEIIRRANDRAEKLKLLDAQLEDAKAQAVKLCEALQYFSELSTLQSSMDQEGRELLPRDLSLSVMYVGDAADKLWRSLTLTPDNHLYLARLVELAEKT